MSGRDWPRVLVHPGTGVVDRHGDTLLVVPAVPVAAGHRVRELLDLCHRPDPTGRARVDALRALVGLWPAAEVPGFALLLRTGAALRVLVHGPVPVLVDGRPVEQPGGRGAGVAEQVLEDGAWHEVTIAGDGGAPPQDVVDVLPLDLEAGTVLGSGATLRRAPEGSAQRPPAVPVAVSAASGLPTSTTQLRPAVQFRTVLLGECAARASAGRPAGRRRPPLPVVGTPGEDAAGSGTTGPEVVVEGVRCPAGHFTDPERSTCLRCGTPLPAGGQRVSLPRPPLGVVVTDGGTIYTVTGDLVIGREAEQAPDVLAGWARPLPLRDAARSTSRVHARLTVRGWQVLLSDERSANGTLVSRSGAAGPWLPVTPHAPLVLVHGDRVRLGKRQLLFDTWREAVVPQAFR
ncbi:FHA domain-containing protein [Geodermatophilus sabuli]|uniref:FHA domain-containing protein n=1 Tax=Geodermatophilus sabuli TaxID=1564158 RepID=A0A285EHN0_9ACTN|nr:FHA domain-containing protein [Geodermatophilus sabuli]MBB3086237.1 hypothetical protein [Geodermatophilus sabuli]SNX97546.1 FHA domain-containing protein [Geodermatophilus sabuli]